MSSPPAPSRPLLLFTQRCKFCRAAARFVAWIDRTEELSLLSLEVPEAAPYVAGIPEEEVYASWHLIEPNGDRLVGGNAGIALLEQVRLTRPLGRLLRWARLSAAVAAVDRFLKEHRGRLNRFVPDVPAPIGPRSRSRRHPSPSS
jgi:predicted DCC family thiol-disulfide oxidoreductase YuxK